MYRNGCKKLFILLLTLSSVFGTLSVPDENESVCIGHADGAHIGIFDICNLYYYCEAEIGYLQDCEEFGDFLFDPTFGGCNYAEAVDCTERNFKNPFFKPQLKEQPTEKIHMYAPDYDTHVCLEYIDEVTLGIEGSCSLYYFCHDGIGYIYNCKDMGADLQYDPQKAECAPKEIVGCDEYKDVIRCPYGHN